MSRYVELPRDRVFAYLRDMGFFPLEGLSGVPCQGEVVYVRPHERDAGLQVRVYTSIGWGDDTARACGKDAIRVTLVADCRGVWKAKRIFRTGTVDGVLERIRERAREAYAVANGILKRSRCRCGGRRYGDSGKCVRGCRATSQMFDQQGVERAAWVKDRDGVVRRVS